MNAILLELTKQTCHNLSSELTGIENYFYQQINLRKLCIKKLSKYVTVFDYIDKILIVLSATTGGVSIVSFSFRIANASFTLIFY